SPHTPRVVVIGGGVTGLSAGFYLEQAARRAGMPLDYLVVERGDTAGGKIHTDAFGGYVVEGGADSFLTQKPWALELVRALGLEAECVPINSLPHATYVLINGRPQPMPPGMTLGIPARLGPFLRSSLLSPWGKARALLDLLHPVQQRIADESLAGCMRRHFGDETLDRILEPLMSGIHNSLAEEQSLLATFPRFRDGERKHGSLINSIKEAQSAHRPNGNKPLPPFMTLRGGMGRLIDALAHALGDHLRSDCPVAAVEHYPGEPRPYCIVLASGEVISADGVILATPAFVSADLIAEFYPGLACELRAIRYVSTGTVSLAYASDDVGPLPGFGVIIPRSEGRHINAITVSSRKFAHRAPADRVLIRAFFGGSRHPHAVEESDAAILAIAQRELREILGITAAPRIARIWRLRDSSPQYDVGHLHRVASIESLCPAGLAVAGSAYRGVGIPDCIKQAQDAATRILAEVWHDDAIRVATNS
ncbi:MAG TPA: protoporphyrinogen oxidase, partial [Ktedonobacterales bacterium]|nr:protoporphyrinogen oxidase [Ktedonobacterales bacterium]